MVAVGALMTGTAAVMRTAVMVMVAGLSAAMILLGAPTAAAHTALITTEPAVDAALESGPPRVSATFNEPLQAGFAAMTVVGPDDNLWSTGETQVQGASASVAVKPLGPAGRYTVNYRVTSADGHVVSGSWSFRLTKAGREEAGPPVTSVDPGASPSVAWWPFLAAGVAVAAAALWWMPRRR